MITYTSWKQTSIFNFRTTFEGKLDANNRWVKLAKILDWDTICGIYTLSLQSNVGAPTIDARIAVGALIIKHIENKDDRGVIAAIQENVYMQYFLGLDQFTHEPVFDPSLLVHIRKRLDLESLDKINQLVIAQALKLEKKKDQNTEGPPNWEGNREDNDGQEAVCKSAEAVQAPVQVPNKGKLQLDATVAPANIAYPTDTDLLAQARVHSEKLIDKLVRTLGLEKKPRTYRREARKVYLNFAKKKKKTKAQIKHCIKGQLGYLKRNFVHLEKLLSSKEGALSLLNAKEYRYYLVIQEVYRQQLEMYQANKHQVEHRIVSLDQPHIRPIVRGKSGKPVEFGAKVNISLQGGYARIDQLDFEAFNEGCFLKEQVERYQVLHGCYPDLLQTDSIYLTKENRAYLKEKGIRHTGKALGRPPKETMSRYTKQMLKKERAERNHIEGFFGCAKNRYGLGKIKAKLANTSRSWIASILLVMNILRLAKDIFVSYYLNLLIWISSTKIEQHVAKFMPENLAFLRAL